MRSTSKRVAVAAHGLALAVLVLGCGARSAPSPATESGYATSPSTEPGIGAEATGVLVVRDGEVEGGFRRLPVTLNTRYRIVVTSDVTDVVHLHGYDLTAAVPAGETIVFEFRADIPGVFEVELEGTRALLAQLEVA